MDYLTSSTNAYPMSDVVTCPIGLWTAHDSLLYGVFPHIATTCPQKLAFATGLLYNTPYWHARMHMSSISTNAHYSDGFTIYPLRTLRWFMCEVDPGSRLAQAGSRRLRLTVGKCGSCYRPWDTIVVHYSCRAAGESRYP